MSTNGYPAAQPVSVPQRPRLAEGTAVDGVWVWVVATVGFLALPTLFLFDMRGYLSASLSLDPAELIEATTALTLVSLAVTAFSVLLYGLTVLAAYRDQVRLQALGVVRPFHWAFSFLGSIVYLIGRHVVLRKVTRTAGWPLWVNIALNVLSLVVAAIWTSWLLQIVMVDMIRMMGY